MATRVARVSARMRRPRQMAFTVLAAVVPLALLGACATGGSGSPEAPSPQMPGAAPAATQPPPADSNDLAPADWDRTILLLHRKARIKGRLTAVAPIDLADEAVRFVEGVALPFDGWARLLPGSGMPRVVAHPRSGPLAAAVASRLQIAAGSEAAPRVKETGGDAAEIPAEAEVLVWQPGWREGQLVPALPVAAEAQLVLVDLFEPRVGGAAWRADAVIAAPGPAEARLVARHVLESRARGRVVDAERLAAEAGLSLDQGWARLAVAD